MVQVVDFEAKDIEFRMRPRGGWKHVVIQHVDDLFSKRSAFKGLSELSGNVSLVKSGSSVYILFLYRGNHSCRNTNL